MYMREALFLLGLICLVACAPEPDPEALTRLQRGDVKAIGHAGNGTRSLHPPNGISGIYCTLANGADGVEVDIRLTLDDTLILYHDSELGSGSHCNGTVESSLWADIRHCEHRALLADDTLLTLNRLIRYPLLKGKILSLDVKFQGLPDQMARERMVAAIARVLDQRTDGENLIESQDRAFLNLCARKGIRAKRLLYTGLADEPAAGLKRDSIDGVSIEMGLVNALDVARWRTAGVYVMLWGATTRKRNTKALDLLPDAIQSDRPSHLSGLKDN